MSLCLVVNRNVQLCALQQKLLKSKNNFRGDKSKGAFLDQQNSRDEVNDIRKVIFNILSNNVPFCVEKERQKSFFAGSWWMQVLTLACKKNNK